MAYKTVNNSNAPIGLDKNNKRAEGFLLDVRQGSKKYRDSRIYTLQTPKGEQLKVWGCAQINQALLDGDGNILPSFRQRMIRLTFTGMKKIKGRKEAMREITVEVDESRKLALKSYKSKN